MPRGSENGGTEWMNNLPARYVHGRRGFDRRLMEELAAVGVPCYTLTDLANGPRTIPQGIPIFLDWLINLETKIPGPETEHRSAIRSGLIRNLIDPAARGNQHAIDLLITQARHQPPLPQRQQDWACQGLALIAKPEHFPQITALLDELPSATARYPLIEYLGKVKTDQARQLAIRELDGPAHLAAINALAKMKAEGVRHLIEPFTTHPSSQTRKAATRALEKLPG
ncbi:HEAT repeat domain-containing protein [Nocardia sp. NPDC050793]|uniref:HEAT repeat domain-containing protein n=1 Tax=Nocardia sp. NPDC050793 TaxID=3155159 RepID=UPI003405EA60